MDFYCSPCGRYEPCAGCGQAPITIQVAANPRIFQTAYELRWLDDPRRDDAEAAALIRDRDDR